MQLRDDQHFAVMALMRHAAGLWLRGVQDATAGDLLRLGLSDVDERIDAETGDAIAEHVADLDRLPVLGDHIVYVRRTRRERPMRRDAADGTRRRARAAWLLRLVTVLSLAALALASLLVLLGVLDSTVLLVVIGYCLGSLLVALTIFAHASIKSSRNR